MAFQEQAQTNEPWQYAEVPAMDDDLYQKWVSLLEQRIGVALPDTRKTFLVTSVCTRMRELKITSYEEYFELLCNGSIGQVEWETLVDRLTVHETRFYRDEHALDLIRNHYLIPLLDSVEKPYTVQAWSVGCATGEEPYTLSIMLEELLLERCYQSVYYGITATDISRAALQAGEKGEYHVRRTKNIPGQLVKRYFDVIDDEHVQVKDKLTQRICFIQNNLLEVLQQPINEMDIVLCQNVLIYFKRDTRIKILNELAEKLKPGGLLVLGAGEVVSWTNPDLEAVNVESTLAFRKRIKPIESREV